MNLEEMIISRMDSSWSLLEKARFIYIELGKLVTFSTKMHNSGEDGFYEVYFAKVSINKLKSLEVNCRMWAQLYSQLLYKAEIPNKIIDQGHSWVEFYVEGEKYIADATDGGYTDLARIKNHDLTIHFGVSMFPKKEANCILEDDNWINKLNYIDEVVGYDVNKKANLIELKAQLKEFARGNVDLTKIAHSEVEDPISFKLDYLFSLIGKLNDGYYEAKEFVYNLEHYMFTLEELEKIGAVELKKTNPDKTVSIIQCIYTKYKEEPTYYLLVPNLPVQSFTANDIISLGEKGYGIESKTIPGIIYPKKFVPGKCSETLSYKLYRRFSKDKSKIDEYAEQQAARRR